MTKVEDKIKEVRMNQYEADIKEKPFVLIYLLGEECDFGENFKTQEEAIEEAKKDVKVEGNKVVVCRRMAYDNADGQFVMEGAIPLVEFERQIVPAVPLEKLEKNEKPVKRIKVKVTRAEVERLKKEREEEWRKR